MAYKGGVRDCNTIVDGRIPLWLTVHEAGHLIARIQLVAACNLAGLENPSSFESIRVWPDERGKPRGLCQWGYREPLSFRYQAIISAAGPVAEARIRHAKRCNCLTAGEDYEIIMRSVRRGLVDIDDALNEATFIVRACWPQVMKLGTHLQAHHTLIFPQISTLLDLQSSPARNRRNRSGNSQKPARTGSALPVCGVRCPMAGRRVHVPLPPSPAPTWRRSTIGRLSCWSDRTGLPGLT